MSTPEPPLQIGIISDTHGLLRPEAVEALAGVNYILHAGDVGDIAILETLRSIAPVTAIRGNVDVSGACARLPATEVVELGGCLFYLLHAIQDLDVVPAAAEISAIVYGHSHRAEVQERDGVVYVNPGSAGPKRFQLPVTMARAVVADRQIRVRILSLE